MRRLGWMRVKVVETTGPVPFCGGHEDIGVSEGKDEFGRLGTYGEVGGEMLGCEGYNKCIFLFQ